MKGYLKLLVNKINIVLFLILALGLFFRMYHLSSVPPSASLDEASIGYNAYSILKTGTDEYGNSFPLLLRAYDDWRPALYVYLVTPFIKILGLNIFAVRLPSVILSMLTIFSTYFLTKIMFSKQKYFINKKISGETIALLTALFLAISPWHIYLSRLGHEANAGLAFFVFAMTFFFRKNIYLSSLFFTLSFISYQSEKIFVPLMLLGLILIYKNEFIKFKKQFFLSFILCFIILIPFVRETLSPNALIRFQATNVINANKDRFDKNAINLKQAIDTGDNLGKIIYNRRTLMGQIFFEGYISHFNPSWLFTNQFNDKHKVPGIGLMYFWEMPFLIIGLIILVIKEIDLKIKMLLMLWLLISPVSAAITTDSPHAMRSYTFLPVLQILSALGIISVFNLFKNRFLQISSLVLFINVILTSLMFLYKQYFIVFPKTQSVSFQYALYKSIPFVLNMQKSYNNVIFSNQENLYQSYMFFLFYSQYDPNVYQKEGGTKSGGFAKTHDIDKYIFRPIKWDLEPRDKNILYVGNFSDFTEPVKVLKRFYYLDNKPGIEVVSR